MERAGNVAVVPATFPWSDVGSWAELLDVLPSDADGNVVQGVHLGFDTQRCLIFASTKPVATVGVRDLIVVETPDVLLICPRDRAQAVKQLVERLGADEAWRHLL
jgi:mannose-1-phosphate guanylyltransferase